MSAYPNLFPSGFIEYDKDSCVGPNLYRSQPSREVPGIVELNAVVEKYGQGQYKGGDFMRLASSLKWISRSWKKLPHEAKRDFLQLIMDSNSDLSRDIASSIPAKEKFGDVDVKEESETPPVYTMSDNRYNILVIVVISIVALVIGFLIAYSCQR